MTRSPVRKLHPLALFLGLLLAACAAGEPSPEGRDTEEGDLAGPPGEALARSEDGAGAGDGDTACGVCDRQLGCVTPSCGCGAICIVPPCVRDDSGVCTTCPAFQCIPSPPYCKRDLDCPLGECAAGACTCVEDADCGADQRFQCNGGICAARKCTSSADCCDESGACLACSADGSCSSPILSAPDPSFSCAFSATEGNTAGLVALVATLLSAASLVTSRRARRR
ncbi:hypothetical protein [Chondromyces apiculatus]|uniref:Uncharacterized protein n=1 Tax=Chondromyces apiculatus DSM 436 TaxID=1192034 RepID=A0A017SW35_9BACT|nr:hypothetical protein [Chondromyces apiculatus]EYF01169.1 Hypothetical protein CAP_8592 [Chondromyces apiculatus DSM 436]